MQTTPVNDVLIHQQHNTCLSCFPFCRNARSALERFSQDQRAAEREATTRWRTRGRTPGRTTRTAHAMAKDRTAPQTARQQLKSSAIHKLNNINRSMAPTALIILQGTGRTHLQQLRQLTYLEMRSLQQTSGALDKAGQMKLSCPASSYHQLDREGPSSMWLHSTTFREKSLKFEARSSSKSRSSNSASTGEAISLQEDHASYLGRAPEHPLG